LIDAAIAGVHQLQVNVPKIAEGPADIPEFAVPENPMTGEMLLSKEILRIIGDVSNQAATLVEALEIAYWGAGNISCAKKV
jgi:hypothetical protein